MDTINDYCNEMCMYSTSLDSFSRYEADNITRVNILILGLANMITLIYIVVMTLEISRLSKDVKKFLVDNSFYLVKNKINEEDDEDSSCSDGSSSNEDLSCNEEQPSCNENEVNFVKEKVTIDDFVNDSFWNEVSY
jgi:hypothetical protein